jgi:hypothetical protein
MSGATSLGRERDGWSSDLRGFTKLSDHVAGEEIIAILDRVFDAQARAALIKSADEFWPSKGVPVAGGLQKI